MDLSQLKSRRYDINKLVEAAQEANGAKQDNPNRDENLWKPTVDKAGNGYAVIRFLPSDQ